MNTADVGNYDKKTRTKSIRDIVLNQKYITNPTVTPKDSVIESASNLADELKNCHAT